MLKQALRNIDDELRKPAALSEETQSLATPHEWNCAPLAALKQSLLHQAFTGAI
jgi:hypothetical protein